VTFDDADILAALTRLSAPELDELPFGGIAPPPDGMVSAYNRTESTMAGLSTDRVIGLNFFTDVAPCTNNYMVAGRFEEPNLDDTIDYVFTLRMKPTPVKLRLLKSPASAQQYVLVQR
jgi:photoactive yellow protein